MRKQSNLALVYKTKTATAQVVARPAGKDKFGHVILSQSDIDRIPDGHRPEYATQLFGKIVTEQIRGRSWFSRLRSRFQ